MAAFGFTYNMMDRTGIECPILSTNWASVSWSGYVNPSTVDYFFNSSAMSLFILELYDPGVADGKDTP